jgi:cytochrome c peroxidase
MRLPSSLPEARGNQYGDDSNAAMLGFALFFSPGLGSGIACSSCHTPEASFTVHTSVATGKGTGVRNPPTVFNAARLSVFFWDGRADSLWSQPLFAVENPLEMGSSRSALAQLIANDSVLGPEYESVFGALPDTSAWPVSGKPGDAAFDALSPDVQNDINRVAANVGKALEAYMRKNTTAEDALDRYLDGDSTKLILAEQNGLNIFITAQCNSCHSGPMFSDQAFHDAGFPSLPGAAVDVGRPAGIPILLANPFNLGGPFADPNTGAVAPVITDMSEPGAFRTPSLRNVTLTAPYGHDGAFDTLDEVLALHASSLSLADRASIIAFFQSLNGDYPPLPWSNWPSAQ